MPYNKREDLPDSVTDHLPAHAQDIYKEAFNNAWDQYKEPAKRKKGGSREEAAHRVAWAAVKKQYAKDTDGQWRKQD